MSRAAGNNCDHSGGGGCAEDLQPVRRGFGAFWRIVVPNSGAFFFAIPQRYLVQGVAETGIKG